MNEEYIVTKKRKDNMNSLNKNIENYTKIDDNNIVEIDYSFESKQN